MWFTFKTSYCSTPKYIEKSVAFYLFIPEKLTQMTKIGNGLYVLVLLNENAHGCHTWLQHRTNHRNTIRL